MNTLKVVSIGGFGHSVFVFDDMQGMTEATICGLAPAYAGEDISFFTGHALCKDKPVFANYQQMLAEVKPDVAIITLIGLEHYSAFRSKEAVAEEKGQQHQGSGSVTIPGHWVGPRNSSSSISSRIASSCVCRNSRKSRLERY